MFINHSLNAQPDQHLKLKHQQFVSLANCCVVHRTQILIPFLISFYYCCHLWRLSVPVGGESNSEADSERKRTQHVFLMESVWSTEASVRGDNSVSTLSAMDLCMCGR